MVLHGDNASDTAQSKQMTEVAVLPGSYQDPGLKNPELLNLIKQVLTQSTF